MIASIRTATLLGVSGHPVRVEVHAGDGLPSFHMVGLPDEACREARDRVRAALQSSGFVWPDRRITVNLAPSQQRKSGSGLDLAIAVGVLVAADLCEPALVEGHGFLGELGLDGSLRAVPGMVPLVAALGDVDVVVPRPCATEAALVASCAVRAVSSLRQLIDALRGDVEWPDLPAPANRPRTSPVGDLAEVIGQPEARLALEVSAAGRHHLLLVGPPGAGKSMLASRLAGLLPDLDRAEAIAATEVHSAAGVDLGQQVLVQRPPYRAPHHSSTVVSLIGGGSSSLRPGEVSLASSGVLFLDELGEFAPTVLDSLRQPLESGVITVSRASVRATLPASVLLVAATNPCPCGGGPPGSCVCSPAQRQRYLRRLSGPLLDRFDLRVAVHRPDVESLVGGRTGESTAEVASRVARARNLALARGGKLNAALTTDDLDRWAPLTDASRSLLTDELSSNRLTGRGYHRIRRVARTVADLAEPDGSVSSIDVEHVAVAMALRAGLDTTLGARPAPTIPGGATI